LFDLLRQLAPLAQSSNTQLQVTGFSFVPMIIGLTVGLAISILVCFLIYNAQAALPPQFQRIPAGQVWLLLIPLFNLVWNFFVFPRVSESYQTYFNSQGRTDVGDAGRGLGVGYSICAAITVIPCPCVGGIAGLAALVLLILFLVKIYGLKAQIGSPGGGFPVYPNQPPPPPPPQM
jgi:hypothetical protein